MSIKKGNNTINKEEVEKFNKIAEEWWDLTEKLNTTNLTN